MYIYIYIYILAGSRPNEDEGLPQEAIYADDTDFISKVQSYLKDLEKIIPPTIGEYNLIANASKWDRTTLTSTINEGKDQANWRLTKKLGSLLGDTEDVERRRSLARESFKLLHMVWERTAGATSNETRVRAYNACLGASCYQCYAL